MEIPNLPDSYFYYGLSIALAIAVISILKWVGGRLVKTLDKLGTEVTDLKISRALHEDKLDKHDQDIEAIKDKVYLIRYVK